jgi:hypothetical protein
MYTEEDVKKLIGRKFTTKISSGFIYRFDSILCNLDDDQTFIKIKWDGGSNSAFTARDIIFYLNNKYWILKEKCKCYEIHTV